MVFNGMKNDMVSRLNEYMDVKGLNPTSFAREVGIDPSNLKKMLKNEQTITNKTIAKIIGATGINRTWLMTGEGEMLTESVGPRINYNNGVPYYDVDFMAGFDLIFNDSSVNPEYLIDFRKYNEATCWCNVSGHSMEPEINHGDIVALKAIADPSFLPYGEVYAIVTTNDMRTIKRLAPSQNPDNYLLVPTNKSPEYGVQELPKRFILKIFKVLGCMKRL